MSSFLKQHSNILDKTPYRLTNKTRGKLLNLYYSLGKHDIVAVVEAPNDEAIASVLFVTGRQGNVRTRTLKPVPKSEAAK